VLFQDIQFRAQELNAHPRKQIAAIRILRHEP
jgi:hypothetical protein